MLPCLAFYMGVGNLKSSSHAYVASTLLAEPSLHSRKGLWKHFLDMPPCCCNQWARTVVSCERTGPVTLRANSDQCVRYGHSSPGFWDCQRQSVNVECRCCIISEHGKEVKAATTTSPQLWQFSCISGGYFLNASDFSSSFSSLSPSLSLVLKTGTFGGQGVEVLHYPFWNSYRTDSDCLANSI